MRRATQWAVFTSMNQQTPSWRSRYEPADRDPAAPDAPTGDTASAGADHEPAPAPDQRRDRVDFM